MSTTPWTRPASAEPPERLSDALAGVVIGTAVGDAIGLPMEGLTPQREQRIFPLPLCHRLIGGRGPDSQRYGLSRMWVYFFVST